MNELTTEQQINHAPPMALSSEAVNIMLRLNGILPPTGEYSDTDKWASFTASVRTQVDLAKFHREIVSMEPSRADEPTIVPLTPSQEHVPTELRTCGCPNCRKTVTREEALAYTDRLHAEVIVGGPCPDCHNVLYSQHHQAPAIILPDRRQRVVAPDRDRDHVLYQVVGQKFSLTYQNGVPVSANIPVSAFEHGVQVKIETSQGEQIISLADLKLDAPPPGINVYGTDTASYLSVDLRKYSAASLVLPV